MNPSPIKNADAADDHCRTTELHSEAAKLDVHRHERLAYTESPMVNSVSQPVSKRGSALLKAFYHWVLSR
jgi:hypothetical protein